MLPSTPHKCGTIWAAFLLYCGLIVILSHQPGDPDHVPPFAHFDKLQHFGAYLLLAVLCLHAFFTVSDSVKRVAWAAGTFTALFAMSDEWHQSFVPLRDASAADVAMDLIGAAAGGVVYFRARRLLRRAHG